MINPPPFTFVPTSTVAIIVAAATANVAVTARQGSLQSGLGLLNVGTAVTFFRVGTTGVIATTADIPIGPNERLYVPLSSDYDNIAFPLFVACIGSVGPTLYITPGAFN